MDSKLNIIKNRYKDEIKNYEFINNINELSIGDHIWYLKKNCLNKKTGIVRKIIDDNIIELVNQQKNKLWYIYYNEYVILKRIYIKNKFKDMLQTLLDTDFEELTTMNINDIKSNKKQIEKTITYKQPCKINIEKIQ